MSMHWIMRRAGEKTIVYNFVHRELTKVPSEEVATIQRTKSDREMNSEEPTREETDEFRRALVAASHSCEQFRIVLRAFPELKLGCPPEWMNKLI